MNKNPILKMSLLILSLCLVVFTSCRDDHESEIVLVESERILGTWEVEGFTWRGNPIPTPGSTINFNPCDGTCDGDDYQGSDGSSSTFTYEFNADYSILTIYDHDEWSGGRYTGDWTISDFTNTSITLNQVDDFQARTTFSFIK